jgi:hypothetical protein
MATDHAILIDATYPDRISPWWTRWEGTWAAARLG